MSLKCGSEGKEGVMKAMKEEKLARREGRTNDKRLVKGEREKFGKKCALKNRRGETKTRKWSWMKERERGMCKK